METQIRKLLASAFPGCDVRVINESQLHHGHRGSPGSGQSHFRVHIAADSLKELSRVAAHRQVYAVLNPLFTKGLHALTLEIGTGA